MPLRNGKLTAQERRFAQVYADTGAVGYAAEKAGYAFPEVSGSKALARPAVQESIKRQQLARLNNELLPLALDTLEGILRSPKSTDNNKNTAAGLVMKYSVGQGEGSEAKEPHEMTAEEIQQQIERLRAAAADRARPVIEPEPSSIDDQGSVFE